MLSLTSDQADIQNKRVEIVALLRGSFLQEEMKKNLMMILPYLPLEKIEPIYQKLLEEQKIRQLPHGMATKKVKEMKAVIARVKREAWKEAEKDNSPQPESLEQNFSRQLSQI